MTIRLVKGAYWDSEIKRSQERGYHDFPVYTRKPSTDVSYLACARRILEAGDHIAPVFGTHNAMTVAHILELAGDKKHRRGHGNAPALAPSGQCLAGLLCQKGDESDAGGDSLQTGGEL